MRKGKEEVDKLKVDRIKEGVVIDHTTAGQSLNVCRILRIEAGTDRVVSIVMNVASKRLGRKDIVKIEGRELDPNEINKISIIAPQATINIIRDAKVVSKTRVKLPEILEAIIKCQNPLCISISQEPKEPVVTKFYSINAGSREPSFRCHYCGWTLTRKEAIQALI